MTQGTGYVGARTRAELEKLASSNSLSQASPEGSSTPIGSSLPTTSTLAPIKSVSVPVGSTSSIAVQSKSAPSPSALSALRSSLARGVIPQQYAFQAVSPNDLLIFGLSHYKIKPGDLLSVTGFGFDPYTTAHIGQIYSTAAVSTSSNSFTIQIPAIPYGTYDFWVSNGRGTSMDESPFKLTVADATDQRPTILSVSPTVAGIGDTITVTADKLDFSGNAVYSNIGIIRSVPSPDGRTMSFKVSQLPNADGLAQDRSTGNFTVTFGIGTAEGQSLNYGYFDLTK